MFCRRAVFRSPDQVIQGHSARGIQRFNKVSDKRISGRDIWSAAVTVCQLVFPAVYCYNDSKIKKFVTFSHLNFVIYSKKERMDFYQ